MYTKKLSSRESVKQSPQAKIVTGYFKPFSESQFLLDRMEFPCYTCNVVKHQMYRLLLFGLGKLEFWLKDRKFKAVRTTKMRNGLVIHLRSIRL